MMNLILCLLVHNGKRNLNWVVVTEVQANVTPHAFHFQDVWTAHRDQAFVKSNLAKLIHLTEIRLVNPCLSPSTISKICPPLERRGEQHVSAALQRVSNSA